MTRAARRPRTGHEPGEASETSARSERRWTRFIPAHAWAGVFRKPDVILALAACVVTALIQYWVFSDYWSGTVTPPWDFYGPYTSEGYAWWHDGGMLDPSQWMPYTWGGFPTALAVQDSSWYLPIGFASLFGPLGPHSFAIIQALEVAFAGGGVLTLSRMYGLRREAALFGLAAYSFAPGLFSNAQHIDIVRGFAFAPWLLAVLSTRWPWRKWWGWLLAVGILWQYAISVYPGILGTSVYIGVVWLLCEAISARGTWRSVAAPMVSAGVVAALLSAVKYVPSLGLGRVYGELADTSVFTRSLIRTVFYGYGDQLPLPNDISMRPFFVVATVAVFAALPTLRRQLAKNAACIAIAALLLGLPIWPWWDAVNRLPGLKQSRFTMNDFKVFLVLGVVLLAVCSMSGLLDRALVGARGAALRSVGRLVPVLLVVCLALILGLRTRMYVPWHTAFALLVAAALLAIAIVALPAMGARYRRTLALAWVAAVLAVTLGSGLAWAYETQVPWRTPALSKQFWGASVAQLVASRSDGALDERPARALGDLALAEKDLTAVKAGNASYFDGRPVVVAYDNLKGVRTFEDLYSTLVAQGAGGPLATFLTAPGTGFGSSSGSLPTTSELRSCLVGGACGSLTSIAPAGYQAGQLRYKVSSAADTTVIFNEAYYPGWSARACDGNDCRSLMVRRGTDSLVRVDVPAGMWSMTLSYEAPHWSLGVDMSLVGILLTVLGSGWWYYRSRRTKQASVHKSKHSAVEDVADGVQV